MMITLRASRSLLSLLLCLLGAPLAVHAQTTQVAFDDPSWDLSRAVGARVGPHNGRQSLYIERGTAILKGVTLADGVIEVDVSTPIPRAFAGVPFRIQSPEEYEEVYVRLHKSGSPDAVQYAPTFNGVTAWQLYGPGDGWARAHFHKNGWVPLRLELEGDGLRVFAGQAREPLLVTRLRRDERSGALGVWALFGAHFSHFRYTPRPPTAIELPERPTPSGAITRWEIASAFPADAQRLERPPGSELTWTPVASEPTGLVNLSRYRESANLLPESGEQVAIGTYARTIVRSSQDQVKKLLFGYSDDVVVFLNGTPVFAGRSGFRSRDPLFQGMIGYHDALYLPLEKGDNELVFAVADAFGGWGLMARLEEPAGSAPSPGK